MASNWIKIEHVTPDKPEIVAMADMLGIDQDSAFGKCVRLWIWADQQTVSGNALSVTEKFLDRITTCEGFANAMLKVGWLHAESGKLSFPNFGRHNGQSSKSRALTTKRVDEFRERIGNGVSVTKSLPEKRREEKNKETTPLPPKRGKRVVLTLIDPNWKPSQDLLDWAKENNLPEPEYQVDLFVSYWQANGKTRADWNAAFRNWMKSPYRKDRQNQSFAPRHDGIDPSWRNKLA